VRGRVSIVALTLALLLSAAGCRSSLAPLEIGFGDDAGTCAQQTDVSCVNYLRFSVDVDDGEGFRTQCVAVTEPLESLCDVAALADGRELFTLDPDSEVKIKVEGLRVFPTTSCDAEGCQRRKLFSGETPRFRIGDLAGQAIPLAVTVDEACGAKEQYFPRRDGQTCSQVCGEELLVCEIQDGCLCKAYEGP